MENEVIEYWINEEWIENLDNNKLEDMIINIMSKQTETDYDND